MDITIFDIANWFLSQGSMTHKKLQKLCYYAYSWFIYLNNDDVDDIRNRMFEERFEAWVHGPVNRELYRKYKDYWFNLIPKSEPIFLEENYNEFLEQIWNVYGDYTGDQLESISHQEKPWLNARVGLQSYEASNNLINERDMFMEYANRQ